MSSSPFENSTSAGSQTPPVENGVRFSAHMWIAPNGVQWTPSRDNSTPDARFISPSVRAGMPFSAQRSQENGMASVPSISLTPI